ncbi:nuclear transport factor 2 family protein [Rhizorhabdus dicambivorans]|nr:nuclear transport factor 2 family protein [Rhizorhabdus dicambivorans]
MDLATLLAERDISGLVTRYAKALDDADWKAFHGLFAEQVAIDTSGLRGVPPSVMDRDAWVARVRGTVEQFERVLHYSTNHVVEIDGDRGACHSHAQNVHDYLLDGETRHFVVHGRYTHEVRRTPQGWRISAVRLAFVMREGEPPPAPHA